MEEVIYQLNGFLGLIETVWETEIQQIQRNHTLIKEGLFLNSQGSEF